MKNKGFTLIEIIIVLAVIAILVSITTPSLLKQKQSNDSRELQAETEMINKAIRQCYALEGRFPPTAWDGNKDWMQYLEANYFIRFDRSKYLYKDGEYNENTGSFTIYEKP